MLGPFGPSAGGRRFFSPLGAAPPAPRGGALAWGGARRGPGSRRGRWLGSGVVLAVGGLAVGGARGGGACRGLQLGRGGWPTWGGPHQGIAVVGRSLVVTFMIG